MAVSASHGRIPYPILNARYSFAVPFLDADGDPTDPAATLDTEFSLDNGAFADAAEEMAAISGSRGMALFTASGAETNGSILALWFGCTTAKATLATLYPRNLAIVGSSTLSAGSAGGGTLGTVLGYDVTGCFIRTTGGTGGGGTGGANNQARRIITYNTSTGAFTVSPNWETTVSTDTTVDVLLPEGLALGVLKVLSPGGGGVFEGTLASATSTTATLPSGGSATNSYYNGCQILIRAGTGAGQAPRLITGYVGSTKVATVSPSFTTTPDSTSQIVILPSAPFPTATGTRPGVSIEEVNGAAIPTPAVPGYLPTDPTKWKGGTIPDPAVTGVPKIDLTYILGTILTETAGLIAAAFIKFFNKATPTGTVNSLPDAVPDAAGGLPVTGTRLTAIGDTRLAYLDALISSRAAATALSALTGTIATLDALLTKIKKYFALALRKDAAAAADFSTELGEINVNGGSGAGGYVSTTDANEALRDNVGTTGAALQNVSANVKKVNDVAVGGDGSATPWGP